MPGQEVSLVFVVPSCIASASGLRRPRSVIVEIDMPSCVAMACGFESGFGIVVSRSLHTIMPLATVSTSSTPAPLVLSVITALSHCYYLVPLLHACCVNFL